MGAAPDAQRAAPRFAAVALAFGPPLLWSGVRAWLGWREGRQPSADAYPIAPLPGVQSMTAALVPLLFQLLALLLVIGVLVLWWRRGGAKAVQRVLMALWVVLWLGAAAWLVVARANTEGLAALPDAQAQVLGVRPRPPTLRELGGTEVIVRVSGLERPQRVRINDERVALWLPGQRLRVALVHGHFYGLYLTGWDLSDSAPAAQ